MKKIENIQGFLPVLEDRNDVKEMFSSGDYYRRVILPKWKVENMNKNINTYKYEVLSSEENDNSLKIKMIIHVNNENELCNFLDALANYYGNIYNDDLSEDFPDIIRYNTGKIIDILLIVKSLRLRIIPKNEEDIYYEASILHPISEVIK